MSDTKNKRKASENHYYFLATFYGDHSNGFDLEVHEENAALWNAWVCGRLNNEQIAALTKKPVSHWENTDQQRATKAEFKKRFPNHDFPNYPEHINFSNMQFDHDVYFNGFIFPKVTQFQSAHFGGLASFKDAEFLEAVNFQGAQFTKEADFMYAQFTEEADFSTAHFTKEAYFWKVQFTEEANFTSSRFEAHSYFQQAIFSEALDFTDASFAQPANFRDAWFIKCYPILEGTNLHGKTTLTAQPKYWPKATDHSQYEGANTPTLESAAAGCAHLRHNMTAQGLPDDAHFFFRREMDCKLAMAGGVKKLPLWLYGKLSDYGYSYGRPLSWLIQLWLVWTLVYTPYFLSKAGVETLATKTTALAKAAGLSFANIFAFFGFHSRVGAKWSEQSNWLIAFTGLETILGFILLFFLGLGLRNQFRLK